MKIERRTTESIEHDLEHETRNLDDRERELAQAREAWKKAVFQCDRIRETVRSLRTELLNARLAAGQPSEAAAGWLEGT